MVRARYFTRLVPLLIGVIGAFASCDNHEESSRTSLTEFRFTLLPCEYADAVDTDDEDESTRFVNTSGYANYTPGFEHGDSVGIFPNGGYQIPFPLPIASGAAPSATITSVVAQGWMTRNDTLYVTYMPFNFYNRHYDRIPWDYRKEQRITAHNSYAHGAALAFFASDTLSADSSKFQAKMRHMGVWLRVRVKNLPVNGPWAKMVIAAQTNAFTSHGYWHLFDVANGQPFEPATPAAKRDYITLMIDNLARGSTQVLNMHMVLAPCNLEGQTVTCYMTTNTGVTYACQYPIPAGTGVWESNTAHDLNIQGPWTMQTLPAPYQNPWEYDETFMGVAVPDFP